MSYKNRFFKTSQIPYCECRYTTDSINHYKPHFHQKLSIGSIKNGVSEFIYRDKKALLKCDTLVAINPGVIHACNPKNSTARSYYMLYLDVTYCYNLQKTIFTDINNFLPIKDVLITDVNVIKSYYELVETLLNPQALILEKEERIESFCIDIFSKYCNKNADLKIDFKHKKEIKTIKEFLKANLSTNPSINELSKVANISKYHLIRIFKNYEGMTPHQYLLNLKVEYAKELLAQKMPIAFVALELGFSDQSHLNRVFKQYFACTPKEFKTAL